MTGKKRVRELARDFGLKSQEVLRLLLAANMPVKGHSSWAYEDEARAVLRKSIVQPAKGRPGMQIIRRNEKNGRGDHG